MRHPSHPHICFKNDKRLEHSSDAIEYNGKDIMKKIEYVAVSGYTPNVRREVIIKKASSKFSAVSKE